MGVGVRYALLDQLDELEALNGVLDCRVGRKCSDALRQLILRHGLVSRLGRIRSSRAVGPRSSVRNMLLGLLDLFEMLDGVADRRVIWQGIDRLEHIRLGDHRSEPPLSV